MHNKSDYVLCNESIGGQSSGMQEGMTQEEVLLEYEANIRSYSDDDDDDRSEEVCIDSLTSGGSRNSKMKQ